MQKVRKPQLKISRSYTVFKNILIKKLKVMKTTKLFSIAVLVGSMFIGQSLFAQSKMSKKEDTKMVGGAAMYPSKNIVENAVNSKDHTTLVAAVKAAELVDVLTSEGPFTVFAPTNAAFDKLPKGTVETLVKPENKEQLQTILKYHVVSGNWNAVDLAKAISDNKGKAVIKTVSGGTITAWMDGKDVYISDENGNKAKVTIADVKQSNGVIHVIDAVLLPKS
jgi:uncharacterized surface protein with fasciclin (FAS1) repeats